MIFDYLNALIAEMSIASMSYKNAKITTVYIGGGTPSLLSVKQISMVVKALQSNFDLSDVEEFTIECNPESITEEKLLAYKNLGINRLSIGVQSLNDQVLASIGRIHNSKTAIDALELATKHFKNVSCDLIVGLPNSDIFDLTTDIGILAQYAKHISLYELSVEKDTKLDKMLESGEVEVPNDDDLQSMFEYAMEYLQRLGFERYEISNFAKDNAYSRHNMGYWTREEYLGFGLGAHSFFKKGEVEVRTSNFKNLQRYVRVIDYAKKTNQSYFDIECDEFCVLEALDAKNEEIMLGLRTTNGVKKELIEDKITPIIRPFFVEKGENLALTNKGMAVMNSIVCELVDKF